MQPHAAFQCEARQLRHGIDHAEGKARRRPHQHDRVGVDRRRHRRHVGAEVGASRHALDGEVHQRGRLVERRMRGFGRNDVAAEPALGALLPAPVAARLDRHDDALGAAAGHVARGPFGRVEQIQPHANDLLLHAQEARKSATGTKAFSEKNILNAWLPTSWTSGGPLNT